MFILKKILGTLLMPLPLSLLFLAIALILLIFNRRPILTKLLIAMSFALLTLLSLQPVSNALLRSLEQQYPPFVQPRQSLDFIVVLGNSHISDPTISALSRPSSASLSRVLEAVRIYKANPNAQLILSGFASGDPLSEAQSNAKLAALFGVPTSAMILLSDNRDTADEARSISTLIGHHPSALVTSASHMPRAMALFARQGSHLLAAPAWYQGKKPLIQQPLWEQMPGALALYRSRIALHEWIGIAWYRLRFLIQR